MTMLTGSRILTTCCCTAVFCALACAAVAADVEVGDTYESVLKELGHPLSAFEYNGQTWLEYDRGKVELKNGKVVSSDLVSEAEGREKKQEREEKAAALAEKRAAQAAEARAKRAKAAKKKAEAKKAADEKKAKVTDEKPIGTPPGLNRRKLRRYSRSKSMQQAWSNKVMEARSQQDDGE